MDDLTGTTGLRVLLVGGGGRDHALAHAFSQSPLLGDLHAVPGNAGIAAIATCHAGIDLDDYEAIVDLARSLEVDLAVIGAEDQLVDGLASMLQQAGVTCLGPSREAARLEGSKLHSKRLMELAGIPTARWQRATTPEEARIAVEHFGGAGAVKADGLAAGCGAFVCSDMEEADAAINALMVDRIFGDAGAEVIVEEMLSGPEVSLMVLTDGTHVLPLPTARDYKRLGDNDTGPNTGGMGAHAPSADLAVEEARELAIGLVQPIVDVLRSAGTPFRGVIYCGAMLTDDGPRVLEYNCRFGNPETQALVRVLDADLLDLVNRAAAGSLADVAAPSPRGAAVAVCVATERYPELQVEPEPVEVANLAHAAAVEGVELFLGLTQPTGNPDIVRGIGGRVVTISAWAPDMESAIERAYVAAGRIELGGSHFRCDIGQRALVGS